LDLGDWYQPNGNVLLQMTIGDTWVDQPNAISWFAIGNVVVTFNPDNPDESLAHFAIFAEATVSAVNYSGNGVGMIGQLPSGQRIPVHLQVAVDATIRDRYRFVGLFGSTNGTVHIGTTGIASLSATLID